MSCKHTFDHDDGLFRNVILQTTLQPCILCQRDDLINQANTLTIERDAYRAMICDLLASAHPHPTEHPTMTKQWDRARKLLQNPVTESRDDVVLEAVHRARTELKELQAHEGQTFLERHGVSSVK